MIKAVLFFLFLSTSFRYAHAQISKGSVMLGGQLQYTDVKRNDGGEPMQQSLLLAPAVGLAVKENLIVSLDLTYANSHQHHNGTDNVHGTAKGAGAFLRKYLSLGLGFYFYGEGRAGVRFFKETLDYVTLYNSTKAFTLSLAFSPGVSFAVNRKFHVESGFAGLAYISYGNTKRTGPPDPERTISHLVIATNLHSAGSLSIGARFFFSR